jgi:acyl dehydratase
MSNERYTTKTIAEHVGRELGVSDWLTIDQARVHRFADCTDDNQWIHVDAARASTESPFGTTIAHGFLTLSLLSRFATEVGAFPSDAAAILNYGLDRVRFVSAVRVGSRIRDRIRLVGVEPRGPDRFLLKTEHTIEVDGEEKPALVAELLALVIRREHEVDD